MKFVDFTIKPSIKLYMTQIVFIIWVLICLMYIRFAIPKHGIYIFQIFDVKNQFIRSKIIEILHYNISYNFLCNCVYATVLVLLNIVLGYWVKTKFTYYKFTNKYLEVGQGVFSQQKDSIDMVTVKDQELHRTAADIALGLSRVKIWSKDEVSPLLDIKGISHSDAEKIFEHLKKASIRGYVDYRLAQDMEKGQEAADDEKDAQNDDKITGDKT
jgi:uncharacterized membrane protein YdbT with pleckstrin-like domain